MSHINEFKFHILRPYYAIKRWYYNKYVSFVEMCASTEHTYISKKLWEKISSENPGSNEYTVFFEKYPNPSSRKDGINYLYRFFINTDLSAISTPDGETPYACKLQLSRFGHMGFQCVQPTPIEILTEYGIADADFCKFNMDDRVRFKVKAYKVNGVPAYEICTNLSYIGYTGKYTL